MDEFGWNEQVERRERITKGILIGSLILIGMVPIVLLLVFLVPKTRSGTVIEMRWERSVEIEEYRTVVEADWYVPYGGRELHREWAICGYDEVFDHWETYYEPVEVFDHYEEVVTWDLNDDGEYEQVIDYEPVYVTSYEEYEEAVYVDVPVYDWWYTYEIERWVHQSDKVTAGGDKEPYWAEYECGRWEREGMRSEKYFISIVDEDGKTHEYKLSFDEWMSLEEGDSVTLKTYATGNAELVFD